MYSVFLVLLLRLDKLGEDCIFIHCDEYIRMFLVFYFQMQCHQAFLVSLTPPGSPSLSASLSISLYIERKETFSLYQFFFILPIFMAFITVPCQGRNRWGLSCHVALTHCVS